MVVQSSTPNSTSPGSTAANSDAFRNTPSSSEFIENDGALLRLLFESAAPSDVIDLCNLGAGNIAGAGRVFGCLPPPPLFLRKDLYFRSHAFFGGVEDGLCVIPVLTESMEELDSTETGGPPPTRDVEDPRENIRSPLGNSTLMVVGCCGSCVVAVVVAVSPSITRKSREGGDEGGVSLKEGEPESTLLLALEDDEIALLRVLEVGFNRFHDPLMLDMDPLILLWRSSLGAIFNRKPCVYLLQSLKRSESVHPPLQSLVHVMCVYYVDNVVATNKGMPK